MKIWYPTLKTGTGLEIYIRLIAKEIEKCGHKAVITWLPRVSEFWPHINRKIIPPEGIDIIHTYSWGGFAFSHHNIPHLTTIHLWVHDPVLSPYKSRLQKLYHSLLIKHYEVKTLQCADRVCTVSQYTKNTLMHDLKHINPQVIYNGIDTDFFIPADPASTTKKLRQSQFRLLFVGSLSRRKGVDLLKPIMDKLGDDYVLCCISQKDTKNITQHNIYHLYALDSDELLLQYQSCDALLFPTRTEGFGYVVAEAMACGKPVISTNCSAIPELITGDNGILCPLDDINAFVAAIRKLAEDDAYRKIIAENARQTVIDRFTIGQMINQYIDLYSSMSIRN